MGHRLALFWLMRNVDFQTCNTILSDINYSGTCIQVMMNNINWYMKLIQTILAHNIKGNFFEKPQVYTNFAKNFESYQSKRHFCKFFTVKVFLNSQIGHLRRPLLALRGWKCPNTDFSFLFVHPASLPNFLHSLGKEWYLSVCVTDKQTCVTDKQTFVTDKQTFTLWVWSKRNVTDKQTFVTDKQTFVTDKQTYTLF